MPQTIQKISAWLLLILLIGGLSGSASAIFLIALTWATNSRTEHQFLLYLLPFGGLMIGFLYHYLGQNVVKGNNQILEEHRNPAEIIPLKMAPLVFIGTLITHLFGGSAGREGTAVQMSAAMSDQFSTKFAHFGISRKTILSMGIAAGFASVFGTPLAGAFFAFEVTLFKQKDWKSAFPIFLVSFVAHFVCLAFPVSHTHYEVNFIPDFSFSLLGICFTAALLFGFASAIFSRLTAFWQHASKKIIKYPPLRPFLGGLVLAIIFLTTPTEIYQGLGVRTIVNSFQTSQLWFVFLLKILFTSFTLGTGFKGGEVTPLFFIGATLGSALSIFLPVPIAFLAAIGFVGVFSGATHTPLACTLMGIELFGWDMGLWLLLVCYVAYFSSGTKGIYSAQELNVGKKWLYGKLKWF